MRIEKIIVNKLFGIFDHEISLNMSDRITILHGKNGVGKTTVLRLVNGFFNSKYSELRAIPFEKLGSDRSFPISIIDEVIPNLERISARRWLHLPTDEILNLDDIIERFSHSLRV